MESLRNAWGGETSHSGGRHGVFQSHFQAQIRSVRHDEDGPTEPILGVIDKLK